MQTRSFNRTTVECKFFIYQYKGVGIVSFNRTTVECKLFKAAVGYEYEETFNRTTVECKLQFFNLTLSWP